MLNGTLLTSGGRYMATMRCGVGWQDGPYAEEAALRRAVKEKQTGTGAIFLALAPAGGQPGSPRTGPGPWGGRAEGYASYMRIDPAHGVIEVGNIMLSPSLQRTTAATEAMYQIGRAHV